jgi:hypothetical protein
MRANRAELARYDWLVNNVVELGLACMLDQDLMFFSSIGELPYIGVLLGRSGGWRPCSYPFGRGKTCSLLASPILMD